MNAYRFSLEWSRIQPVKKDWVNNKPDWINESQKARDKAQEYRNEAKRLKDVGAADQAMEYLSLASTEWERALSMENAPPDANDFNGNAMKTYLNMVKKMVERELTPVVTLNHMTLPSWVLTPPEAHNVLGLATPDAGFKDSLHGWEEKITVKAFEKFIHYILEFEDGESPPDNRKKFKDYVSYWITINEPVGSMIGLGYLGGSFPPGFVGDGNRAKKVLFNLSEPTLEPMIRLKNWRGESAQVGFAHSMEYPKVAKGSAFWIGAGIGAAIVAVIGVIVGGIPWLIVGAVIGGIAGGIAGAFKNINVDARNQYDYFLSWHFLDSVTSSWIPN